MEAASFIAKPLAKLFTKSLATGSLLSDWKAANVTLIYKKVNCHQPRNYRPISLTSLAVKIMEKIIAKKLRAFLDEHSKLSAVQHGFRYLCFTQLLKTIHQWAALDSKIDPCYILGFCQGI